MLFHLLHVVPPKRCAGLFMVLLVVCGTAYGRQGAPVAADDAFNTPVATVLTVEAPGVLANDMLAGGEALSAVLVEGPAHGALAFNADGSFVYTPDDGFEGMDTFTYLAQRQVVEAFMVDETQSGLLFSAEVSTIIGSDADRDSVGVGGMVTADVTPNASPFQQLHITALELVLVDTLELSFRFGGVVTLGRLNAEAEAGALSLVMTDPGLPATVSEGMFLQAGNTVQLTGEIYVDGTGALDPIVPEGPQEVVADAQADLEGVVVQDGMTLRLELPVLVEGTLTVQGNDIDVTLEGRIVATAPVEEIEDSNIATVMITVGPVETAREAPDDLPAAFALHGNYPNPFNPATTLVFDLDEPADVRVEIMDVTGRLVQVIPAGRMAAGAQRTLNVGMKDLASGMYFYRVIARGASAVKMGTGRMVFLK